MDVMDGENDDFNQGDTTQNGNAIEIEIITDEEDTNNATAKYFQHGEKVKAIAKKGKIKGKESIHYKNHFNGSTNGSIPSWIILCHVSTITKGTAPLKTLSLQLPLLQLL